MHHWFFKHEIHEAKFTTSPPRFRSNGVEGPAAGNCLKIQRASNLARIAMERCVFSQKVTWFIGGEKVQFTSSIWEWKFQQKGSWFTWCMDEVSSTMQVRLTKVPNDHESRSTVCFSCCSKGKRKRLQQQPWSWVVSSSSPYFSEPAREVAEILKKHLAKLHDLHRHSFKKPFNKHGLLPLLVTPKRIQQRKAMMHSTKTGENQTNDVFRGSL